MSGSRLEERRELFILIIESNRSDQRQKFRHRSSELLALLQNTVHGAVKGGQHNQSRNSDATSELPAVGTPDAQPSQEAKYQGIGTFGGSRNFRHPELPTLVGTSDGRVSAGGLTAKSSSARTSSTKC